MGLLGSKKKPMSAEEIEKELEEMDKTWDELYPMLDKKDKQRSPYRTGGGRRSVVIKKKPIKKKSAKKKAPKKTVKKKKTTKKKAKKKRK